MFISKSCVSLFLLSRSHPCQIVLCLACCFEAVITEKDKSCCPCDASTFNEKHILKDISCSQHRTVVFRGDALQVDGRCLATRCQSGVQHDLCTCCKLEAQRASCPKRKNTLVRLSCKRSLQVFCWHQRLQLHYNKQRSRNLHGLDS